MVDTHCHITRCEQPAAEIVEEARRAGLDRMLTVGLDEAGNLEQIELAESEPEVFAAVGRHPNSADGFDRPDAASIAELAEHEKVVAIGETGLDFYRETAEPEAQRRAFAAQAAIAADLSMPLVLHLRDPDGSDAAVSEAFATLEGIDTDVILHCFSAPGWVGEAEARGWYCSFAGNVTYPRNQALREAAAAVPDDRILVETDSPYLSPQPFRGKPNRPANVLSTAEVVAEARGVSPERLARSVVANAERVFGW